jgi:hypothetical protein
MKLLQKRLMLFLIALVAVFTLAACGEEETPTPTPLECNEGQELNEAGDSCVDIVIPDTTAPELSGLSELQYTIGDDEPDYIQGITATDDVGVETIVADVSLVDLTTAGTYVVTVTATDAAGNSVSETYNIVVSERVLTSEELVAIDIATLDVSIDNLNLPTFTLNGSFIFWSSSDPNVVSNRGFIFPPPVGSEAVVVTLTARVSNGSYNEEATFDITVEPFGEVSVTSEITVPFTGTSEEYVVADDPEVAVYYVDNGTVPYMDIEEFITMIDGAIDSTILTYTPIGDDVLEITYDVEWEDFDGSMVTETFTATIDFTANTFTVNNYSFFDNYISSTESDYGEGLEYVDAEYVDPVSVTIPLGDYNFDIITYDDEGVTKYLMPFHVNNLLFAGNIYYDAYFNGDEIVGLSYLLDDPDETFMDDLRTSSLNNAGMEEDLRWATVNFMSLMLDYFYG